MGSREPIIVVLFLVQLLVKDGGSVQLCPGLLGIEDSLLVFRSSLFLKGSVPTLPGPIGIGLNPHVLFLVFFLDWSALFILGCLCHAHAF